MNRSAIGSDEPPPVPGRFINPVAWLALWLVLANIAFWRVGPRVLGGLLFVEDGAILMPEAQARPFWQNVFSPVQGYAVVASRILAESASLAPLPYQAVTLSVIVALTTSALALYVFRLLREVSHGWIAPVAAALMVVAHPVSPESVGSNVNLHWYLLFAACLSALWLPRKRIDRAGTIVILLLAATTSPFGFVPCLLHLLRWFSTRDRFDIWRTLALLAGCAAQLAAISQNQHRGIPSGTSTMAQILWGYPARVVGDGILGIWRYGVTHDLAVVGIEPWVAAPILLGIAAVFGRLWERDGFAAIGQPGLLMILSFTLYVLMMALGYADPGAIFHSSRYYLTPALLFVTAVSLALDRLIHGDSDSPGLFSFARVASVLTIAALGFGLLTSWYVGDFDRRFPEVGWSASVREAKDECAAAAVKAVPIETGPTDWFFVLPCSAFDR